jgi:hypothetical protein
MAISDHNVLTKNYHGKVGNLILRVVGGRSIMSAYPDYSKRKWSPLQKQNRKLFRQASIYAKKAVKDPVKLKIYQSKVRWGQHAENMAISDYLLHPEIRDIDVSKYKGQAGNTIKVSAYDKYKIASVIVMILNAVGFEIERGMAMEYPYSGSGEWIYKAKESNPDWQGGSVVVRVTDSPGKVVKAERRLDDT